MSLAGGAQRIFYEIRYNGFRFATPANARIAGSRCE
jgi:hypothetical protein